MVILRLEVSPSAEASGRSVCLSEISKHRFSVIMAGFAFSPQPAAFRVLIAVVQLLSCLGTKVKDVHTSHEGRA